MGKTYKSYTIAYKLEAIDSAEKIGVRSAARGFGIDPKLIRYWQKQKEKLSNAAVTIRSFRGPKFGKFQNVEKDVLEYITETRRTSGMALSHEQIQNKAQAIAQKHGISSQDFKASRGWATRFMSRNGVSRRRGTSLTLQLPKDCTGTTAGFYRFIICKRQEHQFLLSQIGSADRTPIFFDVPQITTVNENGVSSVVTGGEKVGCTVILAITADGRKLPPYVVFKRKTLPKGRMPPGIHVRAHTNGWLSTDLAKEWVRVVWGRRPGALLRQEAMLVLGGFRSNLVEPITRELQNHETTLAAIPNGLTSLLQPLNMSIKQPFKEHLRRFNAAWINSRIHKLTPGGRVQKPSVELLCTWILGAWALISESSVESSFKKTGISNALDGSEDHLAWDHDDDDDNEVMDDSTLE